MSKDNGTQPETPSVDAANDAAKDVKSRGRKRSGEIKAEEKLAAEVEQQKLQTQQFIAQLAAMLTGATNGALAGMDGLYEEELAVCNEAEPGAAPLTFKLNPEEEQQVGTCIGMGLQQMSPEWLGRYGFPVMCFAIFMSIGVPRITLAVGLGKIRADIDKREREKMGLDVVKVPDTLPKDVK